MIMPMLVTLLLGLSALLIVIYPLLGLERSAHKQFAPETAAEATDAAERERLAKQALRDVDFDYRLGNLDEDDYTALRDRYERRALVAMKTRYEREQQLDAQIDQQLAALRSQRTKTSGQRSTAEPRQTGQAVNQRVNSDKAGNPAADEAVSGNAAATPPPRQGGPQIRRRKGL